MGGLGSAFDLTHATVSYWFKEAVQPDNLDALVARTFASGVVPYFSDLRGTNNSQVTFGTYTGSNHFVQSNTVTTTGQWYHVAGTFDGSAYKIYINGVLDNTLVDSTPLAINNLGLEVGDFFVLNGSHGRYFNGNIDDVRIYNTALSAAQVDALASGTQWAGTGTYTAQDALNVSHALTVTAGTLDLSSQNLTTTGATFSNTGNLALAGGQTLTGFTNDTTHGTVTYNGSSTYTGLPAGNTYNNLTFNGSGTWKQSSATTLNGNLTITAGTFDLNSFNLNLPVTNTFSNTGTLALAGTETISNFTLDTDSGTVLYNGGSSYTGLDLGNTYYNLSFNAAGTYTLTGALTVNNNLTITAGTVDVSTSNYAVNVTGNLSNSGTLTPRSSVFTLNGTSQTLTPGNLTFYQLALTGSSGTVTLGSDFTISNLLSVAASTTLQVATHVLNAAAATITNLGSILFGSGGQLQHASTDFYLARSTSYDVVTGLSIGVDSIYATLTDESANLDGTAADTVAITLTCAHDSENMTLTETTNTSGIFRSSTPIPLALYSGSATNNNGTLSCTDGETITASYTDAHDSTDTNSATATATVDTLPTAPSGLSGVPAKTSIAWSFTDNSNNETGFKIYDSSNNLKTTCASTTGSETGGTITCTETGLTKGTNYTRKVVAYNVAGNSAYSSSVTVKTKAEPNAASSFTGTAISSTSITWSWLDNSDDEDGWILEDGNGNTIKTILTSNQTQTGETVSYTETGLTKGTLYTRKMVAYNSDGNATASNDFAVTTLSSPPTAPGLLSPDNAAVLNTGLPSFSFQKSTDTDDGVDHYTLHVGSLTFDNIPADSSTASNPLSATDITDHYTAQYFNENDGNPSNDTITVTLKDGTADLPLADGTYTWYITATDKGGNTKDSVSRTLTIDTAKPQVKGITVEGATLTDGTYTLTNTSPTVTISSSAGAAGSLAQLVVTVEEANTVLGATTSYTAVESSTYVLTGKTATTDFVPKNALTAGKSYRLTFTLTDSAGNTTSQSILLAVLTAEQATQQQIAQLNPNTTPTDQIIQTLRGTLKPSAINLPQLEQTAVLRRQQQAQQFTAFTDQVNQGVAFILKGQGPLERFLAFLLNSAADGEHRMLAFLRGVTQTAGGAVARAWQATTNVAGTTWAGIARTSVGHDLAASAQGLVATGWHAVGHQTAAVFGRVGGVLGAARDVRIRSGLANRQLVTDSLVAWMKPIQQNASHLILLTRATYSLWVNTTPTTITNVQVASLTPTSAVITWDTNHVTRQTKINYGETRSYGQTVIVNELNDHHTVTLTDLKPGTNYYFEVMNQEGSRYVFDAYYTLTTPKDASVNTPQVPQQATIVGSDVVNVRQDPAPTATVIAQVKPGQSFRALLQQDGWIAILLPTGDQGWVRKDMVTLTQQTDSTSVQRNRY